MKRKEYDFDYFDSRLRYEFDTGLLFWKAGGPVRNSKKPAGSLNKSDGYIYITSKPYHFGAHRVAWLLSTGRWPTDDIDHVNRVRTDSRFTNLREATRKENRCNNTLRKDSNSGITGVCFDNTKKKWRAYISKGEGKNVLVGYFTDITRAAEARKEAELKNYGEFAPLLKT